MRVVRWVGAMLASVAVACGPLEVDDVSEYAPKETTGAEVDAAPVEHPTPADAGVSSDAAAPSDAAPEARTADAAATDAAPFDECEASTWTQILCYGTSSSDMGTSRSASCADAERLVGCSLRQDPQHANPDVWCCPY